MFTISTVESWPWPPLAASSSSIESVSENSSKTRENTARGPLQTLTDFPERSLALEAKQNVYPDVIYFQTNCYTA